MVPVAVVAQEVIHPHHEILISDPHPAHVVHYGAFDRLSYLFSSDLWARRVPVQPYKVDEALAGGAGASWMTDFNATASTRIQYL